MKAAPVPAPISFRNAVVVITGASSGIGRAAARRFASEGARVVLASRDAAALEEVAAEVRTAGGEAVVCVMDVTIDAGDPRKPARSIAFSIRLDPRNVDVRAHHVDVV